jgi:hypothetical protein
MSDEYGDVPGMPGTHYAEMDTVLPDKIIHHRGTSHGANGSITFWMYGPRPNGTTIAEWDRVTQERWDRIFGPKEQ